MANRPSEGSRATHRALDDSDPSTNQQAWSATLRLCDRAELTPYARPISNWHSVSSFRSRPLTAGLGPQATACGADLGGGALCQAADVHLGLG